MKRPARTLVALRAAIDAARLDFAARALVDDDVSDALELVRELSALLTAAAELSPQPPPRHGGSGGAVRERPVQLASMPADIVERVLSHLERWEDIAAANAAARLFRGAPRPRSAVERVLRARVAARGHEPALPAALPVPMSTWTELLFERERVLSGARRHALVASAGGLPCLTSAFVGGNGSLLTCGEARVQPAGGAAREEAHPALGHGDAPPLPDPDADADAPPVPPHVPPVCRPKVVSSLSAVRIVAVATGGRHLLALSDAGGVYACGSNDTGQLGLGDAELVRAPARVLGALGTELVVGVAARAEHSLALTAAGTVYSWGYGAGGRLGHGSEEAQRVPKRIEALAASARVAAVAAGEEHSAAISTAGALFCWGYGRDGRLGLGSSEADARTPRRVRALGGVRAVHVSAGWAHTLVVDDAGRVHAFGSDASGAFGTAGDDEVAAALPAGAPRVVAPALAAAARVAAGASTSFVVDAAGGLHACGAPEHGLLGGATATAHAHAHARVGGALAGVRVRAVSVGWAHGLAVGEDGAAYAWGEPSAALGLGLSRADAAGGPVLPRRVEGLPPLRDDEPCGTRGRHDPHDDDIGAMAE